MQVLLVEDSPDDATVIERELRRLPGRAIVTCVDDEASMRQAFARTPFDLVISDWSLPLFSGAAALEVRRELAPDVPFIIVSGDLGEDVAVAAMRAGAGDYVLKDKLRRLVPAIERELREHADRRARRTAEELLGLQDARFRALLEHSSDVITLTSADHRFTYVSPAVLPILGYRPDELIGRACLEVVYPEDRPRVAEFLETLLGAPEQPIVLQYRVIRRDGAVRWMEVTETNRLADRAVAGIIGNVRDITERREAHEQVKASELKYRRIIETTSEGVVVLDSSGRITFANRRMVEIVGREPSTLAGRSIYELVEPAGHPELSLQLEERRRGIRGFTAATLVHRDGTLRQVMIESTPILTEAGEVEGVLAMISDVTARRQAEAALRVSENRFARLAETGIIGIAVAELDGRILEINDALLQLIGYRRDEVLASTFHWGQTSTPDWLERDVVVLAQLRTRGVVEPFEKELLRKDGTRVPVLMGAALVDAHTGIVFVADLSAQKRAEAALVASEQQLRQAQKMEAIGRLAGGVAHDFNNVLSVILSYAEMLFDELAPGAARDDVGEIKQAAMRAGDLTQQLLLFGRTSQTATTLVDPRTVLLDMEKMLRRLLGEDVTLRLEVPPSLPPILIDKTQLEQVLLNLVINARDAMPRGGGLTVSLARPSSMPSSRARITVSSRASTSRWSSPIRGAGSTRPPGLASSSPSSPRRTWARAPGSGCRPCSASSSTRVARSGSTVWSVKGPASRSTGPAESPTPVPWSCRSSAQSRMARRRSCSPSTSRRSGWSWRGSSGVRGTRCWSRRTRPMRSGSLPTTARRSIS
ncbi:MAG: PAS domain S-box protein [Myxococcales bacterium]|nr:PAS domain S-box protein [Myxococcales bacterium]